MRSKSSRGVFQLATYGVFALLLAITGQVFLQRKAQALGVERTISSCSDLDIINEHLDDNYTLTQDIDCFSLARIPIGGHAEPFTGIFRGAGHTIKTYVGTGVGSYAGLFGSISGANIHDLNLEGLVISTGSNVGGLAGEAVGNSRVSHVTSSMEIQAAGDNVGGLIGYAGANVTGSFMYNSASGDVSGQSNVGGLYGYTGFSNVSRSFATGDVTAGVENAGGLIGYSAGYGASEVYASGNVHTGNQRAGGLIGLQENGAITDSYATGDASSTGLGFYVGGLVGAVNATHITRSYSTGSAQGNLAVGGLVGYSVDETYIYDSFTTGLVAGADATVNSLVGVDFSGFLITANAYANADNEKFCMVNTSDEEVDNCTQISISGNPSTFFSASEPPLLIGEEQVWDVTDVWQTRNDDYPILRSSALVRTDPEDFHDYNGDIIPDSDQPNLGGYTSGYTGKIVAIDVGENCELTTDDMTEEGSFPVQDPLYDYANGLWEWEADCTVPTTTVKLYYYNVSASGLTARKFSTLTNTYFTLDDATIEETTINGQQVAVVTYQVTDNSNRDMNLDDGTIQDPAGVASSTSTNQTSNNQTVTPAATGNLAKTGLHLGVSIFVGAVLVLAPASLYLLSRKHLKYVR